MEWSLTTILLATALALFVYLYLFFEFRFSYWRKRGVPHPKTVPFVGNFLDVITGRVSFGKALFHLAEPFRENGYCGIYQWARPIFLVWDPEMVKQIVCKDFSSFHDRGLPVNESDPLTQHLFNLNGMKWRNLRNRLSPTFTSGKLKTMLPLMRDIGNELNNIVAEDAKKNENHEVVVDTVLNRFATDVIGSVAFGIQCNCLRDQKNEFLAMTRKIFRLSPIQMVRGVLESIHPKLGFLLPFKLIFSEMHNFFITLVRDTVKHREENNVTRNDFVQLMMQLRDADLAHVDPANHMELTPGVMAAQGFIFFIAGLDNVSNTVAFALSKLVADPALQERVAAEVRDVVRQHDGEVSYEALKKMELLNCVVMEALRLWSPIGLLIRKANETTKVGDVVIEKGTLVFILTDMMQKDERYFPDPKRFDPERHSAENREMRHPYTFMPFGEGPRNCIAERFALLEMKLALAMLLRDFVFSAGPNYEKEAEVDPKAFLPRPKNGITLKVEARK